MASARSTADVVGARVCWRSGSAAHSSACWFSLGTVCGGRPPDPFFPQVTGGRNEGMTALLYAAKKGSLELCQFLVANKAEVNAKA